ncbi:hypothetical protein SGLAM104S_03620 [Streptomyces glaucescens]
MSVILNWSPLSVSLVIVGVSAAVADGAVRLENRAAAAATRASGLSLRVSDTPTPSGLVWNMPKQRS